MRDTLSSLPVISAYPERSSVCITCLERRVDGRAKMSKLYVGNVPEVAKEDEIKELFEAFGSVEEVALLRGYGFVVS